jgi:Papain family cysteine protease
MPRPSERLRNLQAELSAAGGSWQAADTPQARLSRAQKRLLRGAEPPPGAASLEEREARAKAAYEAGAPMAAPGAPATWDWRNVDGRSFVDPVGNQKSCGSCVAWGTIATVEATMRVEKNDPSLAVDLSEAHLFYCHAAEEGRTCSNGWWPDRALEAFKSKGVVDEGCFPYTPGDQACSPCTDWRNRLIKISAYRSLRRPDEMKAWLGQNGPLIACFVVYDDFMHYRTGVYRHVSG